MIIKMKWKKKETNYDEMEKMKNKRMAPATKINNLKQRKKNF